MLLIKIACDNEQEANSIVDVLLCKELIASAQIKEMHSKYVWKNELVSKIEYEINCFTKKSTFTALVEAVKRNHSYEVPQIIGVDIEVANEEFSKWLQKEVTD